MAVASTLLSRIHGLIGDHDVAGLAVVIARRQAVLIHASDCRQTHIVDQRAEFVCRAGALEGERVVAGGGRQKRYVLQPGGKAG